MSAASQPSAAATASVASDVRSLRERPRTLVVVFVVMVALSAAIAGLVASGRLKRADESILVAAQQLREPTLEIALGALNASGFPPLVDVVYGGIAVLIFLLGFRREAVSAGFTTGCSAGLNHLAKWLVPRERPSPELVGHAVRHISNSSFPAGHVLNLTAFLGVLCVLLVARMAPSWRRNVVVVLMVVLLMGMGIGRVQSGEHWPSDVAAGYLLGIAALCVGLLFDRWLADRLRRRAAARAAS